MQNNVYTKHGGGSMKSVILVVFGAVIYALSLSCVTYAAEQDVNFICRNDCLARGGTIGKCNALCSSVNESGSKTKDMNCLSTCMSKGGQSAYSCYSACDVAGNTFDDSARTVDQVNTGSVIKAPH